MDKLKLIKYKLASEIWTYFHTNKLEYWITAMLAERLRKLNEVIYE